MWKLLQNTELQNYTLYLAAPSGKAADRLKESISDELSKITKTLSDDEKKIFDRLNNSESYTIHRLLSYNPSKNNFSYNSENQFSSDSIFVIDEASMIDINLFASLLEAIPDDAIVFILGDKDQLPSVDAGMVLGALLNAKEESKTELKNSVRFKEDSEIGRLKNAVQAGVTPKVNFTDCEKWEGEFYIPEKENGICKEYPVTYLQSTGQTQKDTAAQMIHRSIRCDTQTINLLMIQMRLSTHSVYQRINSLIYYRLLQFLPSTRLTRFNNTVNNIRTITDLTISS